MDRNLTVKLFILINRWKCWLLHQ